MKRQKVESFKFINIWCQNWDDILFLSKETDKNKLMIPLLPVLIGQYSECSPLVHEFSTNSGPASCCAAPSPVFFLAPDPALRPSTPTQALSS